MKCFNQNVNTGITFSLDINTEEQCTLKQIKCRLKNEQNHTSLIIWSSAFD